MVTIITRDNETSKVISKYVLPKTEFEIWLHTVLKENHRLTNINNSIIFIEFKDTHVTCVID